METKILFSTLVVVFAQNSIASIQMRQAKEQKRPNILFCLADDVSYPYWGAYGCSWVRTPNIDHMARQGMLFMNAYTCNAKSGPSRSCILTGRNTWQLEEACNHFAIWPQKFKTFTEVLDENGYVVAKTGKGWAPGDPGLKDGKKRELIGTSYDRIKLSPVTSEISNIDYAANFNDFIDSRDKTKPFFFWYGGLEPHRAYEYGSGVKKGKYNLESIDRIPGYWPNVPETRHDMLDFAFELQHFDDHLGRMLQKLEEDGLLENTVIVVTADNGMPFPRVKGQAYHASNHLPMAIWWPKAMKMTGVKNEDFVNFIDFAPTFLEIAGINGEAHGMQPIQGKSLLPIFVSGKERTDSTRDHILIGKERHDIGRPNDEGYPIRAIVTADYLYVYNFETERWPVGNPETGYLNCDGGAIKSYLIAHKNSDENGRNLWMLNFGKRSVEELYDLREDVDCLFNLAVEKKYETVKKTLKEQLFRELDLQGDPRVCGRGEIFDHYPYCDAGHRDYYNRVMKGEKLKWPGWIYKTDIDNTNLIEKMP